ncbi:GntR family transcriptional regulator [Cryobacterium tepidiphilum]|uniref:GntR family transcriptional regulator n=1 Tax=Cryobacterium tepidiphilum TaxID=2486026 RepID=A0A3M8LFI5_9MICO|nr:GntR family transcriptional regulator [Cryobacterium tepidiphilum]
MADGALDGSSRTPLHAQLAAILRGRIADTSLPPGSALPTEAELQEQFGISRSVVRQALLALTAEGLITRGRGRGSVVAPRGEHHRLVQRTAGLSAQIATEGEVSTTEIVDLGPERNSRAEAQLGVSRVLALRRIRSVAGEPIALIHTWLPLPLAAALTADELTDASLHAVMREKLGVVVTSGRRQVRAVAAMPVVARALGTAEGAPVLLLEGTSVDADGRPVEVFSTWHRADRVIFDIDVVDDGAAGSLPVAASGETYPSGPDATPSHASCSEGHNDLAARARALAAELSALSAELERRQ